ncbi:MAG: VTT domain-containing protein [Phycisphaerales bacterium]|nr:TVP38/TMEM64 family protein [Planctomycetota bacterium]
MPHPVLRWVGRIGLVIYLPLALSLFLWKKASSEFQDSFVEKVLQPDELIFFIAIGLIGAILVSIGIVNEIGRHRIEAVWKVLRQMGATAVLGAVWTISPAVLGITLLWFLGPVSDLLRSLGAWGWLAYVLMFVVSAGVGFLPTYGQSLLGGWVFGFAFGFPGAMLGFVGGSVIGYFIAKRLSKHKVEDMIAANEKARQVRDALVGHGFWRTLLIITVIRVPPNSPFALTNLVLASSGVRLLPYIVGTAIGMAPRTGIVSWVASAAAKQAPDIQTFLKQQPAWVTLVGIAITVVAFTILYFVAEHAMKAVTTRDAKPGQPEA